MRLGSKQHQPNNVLNKESSSTLFHFLSDFIENGVMRGCPHFLKEIVLLTQH